MRIALKHIGSVVLAALVIPPVSAVDKFFTVSCGLLKRFKSMHDVSPSMLCGIPYATVEILDLMGITYYLEWLGTKGEKTLRYFESVDFNIKAFAYMITSGESL